MLLGDVEGYGDEKANKKAKKVKTLKESTKTVLCCVFLVYILFFCTFGMFLIFAFCVQAAKRAAAFAGQGFSGMQFPRIFEPQF